MTDQYKIFSWRKLPYQMAFASLLLVCCSCASGKLWLNTDAPYIEPVPDESPAYTLYAIGDAGEDNAQSRAVLSQLGAMASGQAHPGMVIFLGDNIYPAGMPSPQDHVAYEEATSLLRRQIGALDGFSGQIIFIPGNHDWNEFKPGGLEAIRRQETFLKEMQDLRVRMLPQNGCGGPVLLQLTDDAVMIILDSQWWIQKWEKEPGMNEGCPFVTRDAMLKELDRMLDEHHDKQILMAFHHPIMTQGHHGGHFTLRDHLFPLTKVVKWLWIPMPVIGSIYPGYRSILGHPQDLPHPRYRSLRDSLLTRIDQDKDILFLSGHDHNLQYLSQKGIHVLLSGGGAKQNHVANGRDLVYGHKAAGFMQLDLYSNNNIQLSVYEVDVNNNSSKIVFRKTIVNNQLP